MNVNSNWWAKTFDDDFYEYYYKLLKPNYNRHIKKVVAFAKIKKGDKILDLACGSGGHLVALKKLGFKNMVGIDYNYYKKANKNVKGIKIKKGDMRDNFGSSEYDFIMINSSSFGYFNNKDNKKVLINCSKALKSGGKLFIDQVSREFLLKNFIPESKKEFNKNIVFIEERQLSADKNYLLSTRYLAKNGKVRCFVTSKIHIYSSGALIKLFKETNFTDLKIKKMGLANWFLATAK